MDRDTVPRTAALTARLGLVALLLAACNKPPPKQPDTSAEKAAESDEQRPPAKVVVAKGLGAQLQKAQRESACVQAMQVKNAVEMYRVAERSCPPSLQALADGGFVLQLPVDPWKHAYVVECDGVRFGESGPSPAAARKQQVKISIDETRLSAYGLTMEAIAAALSPLSAGKPDVQGTTVEMRSANDPEKLVALVVSTGEAGSSVRLGDVATIEVVVPELLVLSLGPDGEPDTEDDVLLGSSGCE